MGCGSCSHLRLSLHGLAHQGSGASPDAERSIEEGEPFASEDALLPMEVVEHPLMRNTMQMMRELFASEDAHFTNTGSGASPDAERSAVDLRAVRI